MRTQRFVQGPSHPLKLKSKLIVKAHTKIYLKFFDYDESDWIQCEIPLCGKQAVDIHHINARGMGGTKSKDDIENLMALCREHHHEYGDISELKEILTEIHLKFIQRHKP